jgi:hypothetical protein
MKNRPDINEFHSSIIRGPFYWALVLMSFRQLLPYARSLSIHHQLRCLIYISLACFSEWELDWACTATSGKIQRRIPGEAYTSGEYRNLLGVWKFWPDRLRWMWWVYLSIRLPPGRGLYGTGSITGATCGAPRAGSVILGSPVLIKKS